VFLRGEAFDEAAGPARQRHDPAAIAVNLMDPAEHVAVERPHLGIAQVA